MAEINPSIDSKKDDHGKNVEVVYCSYCPSKILNPGAATYVNYKVIIIQIFINLLDNLFYLDCLIF